MPGSGYISVPRQVITHSGLRFNYDGASGGSIQPLSGGRQAGHEEGHHLDKDDQDSSVHQVCWCLEEADYQALSDCTVR